MADDSALHGRRVAISFGIVLAAVERFAKVGLALRILRETDDD